MGLSFRVFSLDDHPLKWLPGLFLGCVLVSLLLWFCLYPFFPLKTFLTLVFLLFALVSLRIVSGPVQTLIPRGAWVAQSINHPTLDFGSGHDLTVVSSSPASGSVLSGGARL